VREGREPELRARPEAPLAAAVPIAPSPVTGDVIESVTGA
jgi:hypothetical protein